MINRRMLTYLLIIGLMVPATTCLAADITEQDVSPSSKRIYLEPQKSFIEKGSFNYLLGVSAGYDNNAHLDSNRDKDSFFQTFFRASFNSEFTEKTTGKLNYEMMNLLYTGESDLTLVKNGLNAEVMHKINEGLSISSGTGFDVVDFVNSGDDDYIDGKFEIKASHKLPDDFYHSLRYGLIYRIYDQRHTRVTALQETDKERKDWRNIIEYEIGKYFKDDSLKFGIEYFNNNSNEKYLDYYDYDSYKIKASHTHLFTEKIFSYLSFAQQMRNYKNRSIINDASTTQWERTMLSSAAVFYNLNKTVSFGLNYTYRQNYSNEPVDRYSGSLISLSTYWKF